MPPVRPTPPGKTLVCRLPSPKWAGDSRLHGGRTRAAAQRRHPSATFGRCEFGRAFQLGCGLGVAAGPGEDVRPHRAQQVIAGHPAVGEQWSGHGEYGFGSVDVEYGDRAVELHDG
nr:hypothetical protein GCM10020063_000570 [Dactylosporangium thailandense]